MAISRVTAGLIGAATALGAQRVLASRPARLATLSGTSIAAPSAVGWITDFLNAAYYAKPLPDRDLSDLRLAFCILTTRWAQLDRPLRGGDVAAFHRSYAAMRWSTERTPRGLLDTSQLQDGAAALLGDWFSAASADHERTGWGIAFPTAAARRAHDPERRLAAAKVGQLSPPAPPGTLPEQTWHTYGPVEVDADGEDLLAALTDVAHWPDYASELGRFTPLRRRGLEGQTFEIEVVGLPTSRTPVLLRGYVTVTRLATRQGGDLDGLVAQTNHGVASWSAGEEQPVPSDAEPLAGFDLTTHEGHFMGRARSRLLAYRRGDRCWLRAVGIWDPMDWHLAQMYDRVGRTAQHAFWGMESPRESMLHQIALAARDPAHAG